MLNNFKVLLGLMIVIAGFAYYVTQSSHESSDLPRYLMPSWQDGKQSFTQIDQVKLSQDNESIVLHKKEAGWQVNGGFYANLTPLSALFQSLKEAEFIEAKTKNPENYSQLELNEENLKITLYQGEQLVDAIHVGKTTNSGHVFVRRADENQTYLVKGLKPPTFNLNNWMLTTVVDVPANEVVRLTFEPVEGGAFTINRDSEKLTLELVDIPESHQVKATTDLNNLAGGLTRLMIDEAIPLDLTDKILQTTNTYQLSDNSEVILKLYQQDEQHFLTISGDKMTRYQPWMMKIASYKYDALYKNLEDLIEPISDEVVADSEVINQPSE